MRCDKDGQCQGKELTYGGRQVHSVVFRHFYVQKQKIKVPPLLHVIKQLAAA